MISWQKIEIGVSTVQLNSKFLKDFRSAADFFQGVDRTTMKQKCMSVLKIELWVKMVHVAVVKTSNYNFCCRGNMCLMGCWDFKPQDVYPEAKIKIWFKCHGEVQGWFKSGEDENKKQTDLIAVTAQHMRRRLGFILTSICFPSGSQTRAEHPTRIFNTRGKGPRWPQDYINK